MRVEKEDIRRSFSRAASGYDGFAGLQAEVAESVLAIAMEKDLLLSGRAAAAGGSPSYRAAKVAPRILDIGTGTGTLAALLKGLSPSSTLYAIDIAPGMIEEARRRLGGNAVVVVADCESLPFAASSFDMAASSLAFQWAHDLDAAFSEAFRVLSPGGAFVLSTLGPMTLNELRECLSTDSSPAPLHCADDINRALSGAGFTEISIEKRVVLKVYPGLMELLRTLRGVGAAPRIPRLAAPGARIRKACSTYAERHPSPSGGVVATYEVITVSAGKPI